MSFVAFPSAACENASSAFRRMIASVGLDSFRSLMLSASAFCTVMSASASPSASLILERRVASAFRMALSFSPSATRICEAFSPSARRMD